MQVPARRSCTGQAYRQDGDRDAGLVSGIGFVPATELVPALRDDQPQIESRVAAEGAVAQPAGIAADRRVGDGKHPERPGEVTHGA